MAEIIPAIIGQDFTEVSQKISRLAGLASWVQLDIMDGIFVPEYSWQRAADLESLNDKLKLEAHLMVREPEDLIEDWLAVVDRVIIHLESTEKLAEMIARTKHLPIEFSIALLLETDLAKLESFMGQVKNIQLMSIATIGHYGEPLDEKIYERVKTLRQKYPSVKISVDGGVTLANAKKLVEAGADRLVVGSAIWNSPDLAKALRDFQNVI